MSNRYVADDRIKNANYGQLQEALQQLGFERKDGDDFTAYVESSHDALIALPILAPEAKVRPAHLAMVRMTLYGKGIVSQCQFHDLLARIAAGEPTNCQKNGRNGRSRAAVPTRAPALAK